MPICHLSNQVVAALKAMPNAIFVQEYGIERDKLSVLQKFGAKLLQKARKKKVDKIEEPKKVEAA